MSRFFGAAIAKISPVKYLPDSKRRGYDGADFMLRPDLSAFRATDVSRGGMAKMFEIGYETAKAEMPRIKEIIRKCPKRRKKTGAGSRTGG